MCSPRSSEWPLPTLCLFADRASGRWAAENAGLPFTEENALRVAPNLRQPSGSPEAVSRMNSQQAFDIVEAQAAAIKRMQEEQLFESNAESPTQLIEAAAQKFQDAGLPVGQVGEAL